MRKIELPPEMKPLKSNITAIKPGKLSRQLIRESKRTNKTISAIVTDAIIDNIDKPIEQPKNKSIYQSFSVRIDDNLKDMIEARAKELGESPHKIIINCLKARYQ